VSVRLESAYRKELHNALEKCQFIEDTLRMCILSAVEIARFQLSPYLPVKYKAEDISKLPLGALVSMFSKINSDMVLQDDLRKITKDRNEVAHRSLLFTIGELRNKAHMSEVTRRMKGIVKRATDVHNRVLDVRYELIQTLSKVKRLQENAQP
jgi:hypothetical protein